MEYSCKLSSDEFRKRKATIIAKLSKQVVQRQSLNDGFAYTFKYSDDMLTELIEFVKTERQCLNQINPTNHSSDKWNTIFVR